MTQSGQIHNPQELFRGPRLLGTIAWGAIILTAILALVFIAPVLRAFGAGAPAKAAVISEKLHNARYTAFEGGLVRSDERIKAREPFGNTRLPDPPPVKPSVPERYGGSPVVGVINDTVIFADGRRVEVGGNDGTVEVVSLELPWSVRLRWKGWEGPVALFERGNVNLEQPLASIIGALPPLPPPVTKAPTPGPGRPGQPRPGTPGQPTTTEASGRPVPMPVEGSTVAPVAPAAPVPVPPPPPPPEE